VTEHVREAPCFGGRIVVRAAGTGMSGLAAPAALVVAVAILRRVHDRLSCFDDGSELSRLNRDDRPEVPAGALLRRFAAAVAPVGWMSGGLVDATVGSPAGLGEWRAVGVDDPSRSVRRPAGVRLDSGGLAKGLAADLVAERLTGHASWAVECLGDVRVGGTEGRPRPVQVADPFGGDAPVATLPVVEGAIATSGTTRRTGHLIDPRTGEPADTGIVQTTALAPTGLEAEVRAKAALLAGPRDAARHLLHGGVIVLASGAVAEVSA